MTKRLKRLVNDNGQLSLFDRLVQEQAERQQQRPGRHNIDVQLNAAIDRAISHYIANNPGKSKATFCDELSDALGFQVKLSTINNFLADSHPHRWPAGWVPSICIITGCNEPINVLNDAIGVFTLPGPDALRAEIQKLDEQSKDLLAQKRTRMLFLKELEGKR
jgi:hypothetical protein